MRRKFLLVTAMVILAVLLALFMAFAAAEEGRTDAGEQGKHALEGGGAAITGHVEEPRGGSESPDELDGDPVTEPSAAASTADGGIFARIGGNTFTFMSGAGGWWTEIVVSADGSFTGYFHDADMGDAGEGYPKGTLYECYFSGMFAVTGMRDQNTYELRLAALDIESDTGAERIADGVKVINTDAYGIEGGDVFMLYCPGRETADLPEGFLEWICMPHAWEKAPETLPFYGLYNVGEGTGFFSHAE